MSERSKIYKANIHDSHSGFSHTTHIGSFHLVYHSIRDPTLCQRYPDTSLPFFAIISELSRIFFVFLMIQIQHLAYQHTPSSPYLFEDLCLDIESGDFIALMGASGVGKSTLLSLLAGLKKPSQGQVLLSQKNIASLT